MTPDQAAVRAALTALEDAFRRQDVDTVLRPCTDDVVFVGSGEGEEGSGGTGSCGCWRRSAPGPRV